MSEAFMFSPSPSRWSLIGQRSKPLWRALLRREAHPSVQFFKYAACGIAAATLHNGVMGTLSLTLFPAGKGMTMNGELISESLRAYHLVLNNAIAWPFGTALAYWLNTLLVFTPGKHSKTVEIALFWIISAIGFFPGGFVVHWLAQGLGLPSTVAQLGFVLTSVAVNFLSRKFIIFKS